MRSTQFDIPVLPRSPSRTRQTFFRGQDHGVPLTPPAGTILGLLSGVSLAARISKVAHNCHLASHNSDRAELLWKALQQERPVMVLIDWDTCECEGFRLLEMMRGDETLRKLPVMGFVSQKKADLKPLAQRAGCDRVLTKTEFMNQLENLIARCSL